MTTHNGAIGQTTRRHTHRTQAEAERCPLCGSPITAAIRAQIELNLRARLATAEQALRDQFAREQRQAASMAAAELAKAKAEAETMRKQALEREATIRRKAIEAASSELASKVAEAVAAERSKMLTEKFGLEQKVNELQRRLRAEPAHMIGDPAERDLHTRLAQSFPADQLKVSRVARGVRGPDLFVEILEGAASIGRIAVECKQHARWSRKFISKLKADAEGTDFAVLASSIMPTAAGGSRLHVQDGVIVVDPVMVPALVGLLRRQIVEAHRQKLTAKARDQKAEALLAYIAGPRCANVFDKIASLTADLLAVEESDANWQQKARSKRVGLIHGVQAAHNELVGAVNRILANTEAARETSGPEPVYDPR